MNLFSASLAEARIRLRGRSFRDALRDSKGAIDLASIMVGVLVIGVIGGVIAATVFAVIPWSQDSAARSSLSAVAVAESTSKVMGGKFIEYDSHGDSQHRAFETPATDGTRTAIQRPDNRLVIDTNVAGEWIAVMESDTGKLFQSSSASPEVVQIARASEVIVAAAEGATPGADWDLTNAVIPAGFTDGAARLSTMADDVVADEPYDFTLNGARADAASMPGFAPAAAPIEPPAPVTSLMSSVWDTSIAGCTTIVLPIQGTINATVNWGDGSAVVPATSLARHTYSDTPGLKTVTIDGTFSAWNSSWDSELGINGSPQCITRVTQWDDATGTTDLSSAFAESTNLVEVARVPNTVTNMSRMFFGATSFNGPVNFDTANVTSMWSMFRNATAFNGAVNFTDTSKVTDTAYMFYGARAFNQPLSLDTGNVTDMGFMFNYATAFNGAINFTDTSKVTNMKSMFAEAKAFNQPVGFNTASVTDMGGMFYLAQAFNQPVNFNTANATQIYGLFESASSFNSPVTLSDTSKVTNMNSIFQGATVFNQPVTLNTSNVTNLEEMFKDAKAFNSTVSLSNTSKVTNMNSMFQGATVFNQPVPFNTANVVGMRYTFENATKFNQNLRFNATTNPTGWNVGKVSSTSARTGFSTGATDFLAANKPGASGW